MLPCAPAPLNFKFVSSEVIEASLVAVGSQFGLQAMTHTTLWCRIKTVMPVAAAVAGPEAQAVLPARRGKGRAAAKVQRR